MYPTDHGGRPSVRRGPLRAARAEALRITLTIAAAVMLAACSSGPDPVASFVTGDGPQYFVRPIEFRGVGDTDGAASVDVTVYETGVSTGAEMAAPDGEAVAGETAEADAGADIVRQFRVIFPK
ncbi:MAG: hypothetical protein ACOCU4_09055, partial [Alkalispirochaeta sp.]